MQKQVTSTKNTNLKKKKKTKQHVFYGLQNSWETTDPLTPNMGHVLSNHGEEVPCYFLIGRAERVFKTVSAPDLTPLNTDGAVLPVFSVKKEKQQPEYFTFNEAARKTGYVILWICTL